MEDICKQHWAKYGRNYYARYDYEGIAATETVDGKEKNVANIMMDNMVAAQPKLIGTGAAFNCAATALSPRCNRATPALQPRYPRAATALPPHCNHASTAQPKAHRYPGAHLGHG